MLTSRMTVHLNNITVDDSLAWQEPMTEFLFCEYRCQAKLAEILSTSNKQNVIINNCEETTKYPVQMLKVKTAD